jgi:hypothetical protein
VRKRGVGAVYFIYFLLAVPSVPFKSRALELASMAVYVLLTVVFFGLLYRVNLPVSVITTGCSLVGQALALANHPAAGLVLDGLFLIGLGYLLFRSRQVPRPLAMVVALAGAAWLTFAVPSVAERTATAVEVLGFLAELALMLWLVIVGLRVPTSRSF